MNLEDQDAPNMKERWRDMADNIHCLLSLSCAMQFGRDRPINDDPTIRWFLNKLDVAKISYCRVTTYPGWWNLNQDWFEFECDCETDWGWVRPLFLEEEHWERFWMLLQTGVLIMHVNYKNKETGELVKHY